MPANNEEILFIEDTAGLERVCARLKAESWFTLDTEFLRERTYYTELCLIQVANSQVVACLDPLAIEDLSPLKEVLYDRSITKVLHAAFQDLEIFLNLWGELPSPIFDTQVASTLAGHGDQIGDANLVSLLTGIQLDKDQTRTDWSRRPLVQKQIDYAANDVIYLREVYTKLRQELEDLGRLDWLAEDFKSLTSVDRYQTDDRLQWRRIKGHDRLRPKQLGVLRELAAWREEHARTHNKPRQWIVRDPQLLDLARHMPTSQHDLGNIRGLTDRFRPEQRKELLTNIQQWKSQDLKLELPKRKTTLSPDDQANTDLLMAALRIIANDNRISPGAIASRKDMGGFLDDPEDSPLMQGWKKSLAGEPLKALLAGELSLRIEGGKPSLA